MPSPEQGPLVLVVLDGWGCAPAGPGNAIEQSHATELAKLAGGGPSCLLEASGRAVGLPAGVMGNSEVGHLTIGTGRVVDQDLVRIGDACVSGAIGGLPAVRELFARARAGSGRLHLLGLCSDAGVHSDLAHLEALARAASGAGVPQVWVHAFTDGRDTPPDSAPRFVARLEGFLAALPQARVATIGGRYFAMDRDQRWERVERAWKAMVDGDAPRADTATGAVAQAHAAGTTDEFIPPVVVDPDGVVRDGDAVFFTNFRADRARQLTRAFVDPAFDGFVARRRPRLSAFATMTEYAKGLDVLVVFPPLEPRETLGEVFSRAGWPQLRLAETEKYAHVTYFLDGGREEPFPGEERMLVPSAKVATYDEVPAMAAHELTAGALAWIERGGRSLLVMNFANADMVGHTGRLAPTVEACRVVDGCVGSIARAVEAARGVLAVTADHGNAEQMLDARGQPHTAHTTSLVPFLLKDAANGRRPVRTRGGLSDVAPTLLDLAGLDVPRVMTGRSLLSP